MMEHRQKREDDKNDHQCVRVCDCSLKSQGCVVKPGRAEDDGRDVVPAALMATTLGRWLEKEKSCQSVYSSSVEPVFLTHIQVRSFRLTRCFKLDNPIWNTDDSYY